MYTINRWFFNKKRQYCLLEWTTYHTIHYYCFYVLGRNQFCISYFAFKGKIQRVLRDEELKLYFKFIAIFTIIAALIIYFKADLTTSTIEHPMVWGKAESSFRHALFQVISVVTTTGFITADYTLWAPLLL